MLFNPTRRVPLAHLLLKPRRGSRELESDLTDWDLIELNPFIWKVGVISVVTT